MRTLPVQQIKFKDYSGLQRQVFEAFYALIFKPLMTPLLSHNAQIKDIAEKPPETWLKLRNSEDLPLMRALRSGLIQYKAGIFSGRFSREIVTALRRLGARFDGHMGVYKIDDSLVPSGIKSESAIYEVNAKNIHTLVLSKLDEIQKGLEHNIDSLELSTEDSMKAVDAGFKESAKSLEVLPELTEASQKILVEEYTENLKLFIREFSMQMVKDLRKDTEENATQGYRFDRLSKKIESQYKTSAAKADFLAAQETRLYMAEVRKLRFKESGISRYIWRNSGKGNTRPDHKRLNGRIFFYDDPPIVDTATGRRANPGQDFGCLCNDEPILDPVEIGS